MKLSRTVKVGRITNLSDARYCAGMGVHMLGFNAIEGKTDYVSPESFQSLRGWFTGPAVVAEVYGLNNTETMHAVLRDYLPDFVELGIAELPFIDLHALALIVAANGLPYNQLITYLKPIHNQVAFIMVDSQSPANDINEIAFHYPVLLKLDRPIESTHLSLPVKGFALEGSPEERPGLKNYDDLAAVLEKLSED
ncbi:MAG: hypothetical protein ACK4RF_04375 [Cyclobacteriaceae bacterium]